MRSLLSLLRCNLRWGRAAIGLIVNFGIIEDAGTDDFDASYELDQRVKFASSEQRAAILLATLRRSGLDSHASD